MIETDVTYHKPSQGFKESVDLEDPAIEVMTDFTRVTAISVNPCANLEQARERMISRGVQMLFVTNQYHEVMGLITINDLNGTKPIQVLSENGGKIEDIMVRDIMTPRLKLEALDFSEIQKARVGDLLETFKRMGRQHALVVEKDEFADKQTIRGVLSTTQLSKQLGYEVQSSHMASNIAEMARKVAEQKFGHLPPGQRFSWRGRIWQKTSTSSPAQRVTTSHASFPVLQALFRQIQPWQTAPELTRQTR
ncbi:CBS domain-containing protein [Thiolapillus sp.]|uniref:CBS domain-containing protein n=1 Tax=Thiolapillus sp. TaxID=2017437 RepID=UPI003AF95EEE